jgi:uncharacterized membrane protein
MSSSNSTAVDVIFVVAVIPVEARQFDILVIATEIGWYEIFLTILLILFNLISAYSKLLEHYLSFYYQTKTNNVRSLYSASSPNFCKHEG